MPINDTLIDDLMTLGGNMLGNLVGARGEVKAQAQQRIELLARKFDLVSREEFEAAFAMLAKTREMQEQLSERLAVIESRLKISKPKTVAKKKRSRRK